MKLLFAIKTMDSKGGGAERVLTQVAGELVGRGHEVTLLSFDAPGSPDFYAVDERVHRVWLSAGRSHAQTGVTDLLRRVHSLRRVVPRLHPDVAVGFMHSAFVPLSFGLVGTGIPVVGSEHIVRDHYAARPTEWLALKAGVKLCACVTVVSEQARAEFPASLARKMVVIPNPVGPAPGFATDGNTDRCNVILNVGRLAEQKDQQTLIAAFSRIASTHQDWRLRIVGEGHLHDRLEAQARQLGIAERVELPGPSRDIWAEYAKAQIFALSSTYESFGLATAEALSAGLPAVGFADCVGTNELIEDGINGLLVNPTDRVAGMALALDRLIRFPADRARMAASAPGSVKALSVQEVVTRWEGLFTEVRKPPPRDEHLRRAVHASD